MVDLINIVQWAIGDSLNCLYDNSCTVTLFYNVNKKNLVHPPSTYHVLFRVPYPQTREPYYLLYSVREGLLFYQNGGNAEMDSELLPSTSISYHFWEMYPFCGTPFKSYHIVCDRISIYTCSKDSCFEIIRYTN